jgi:thiol-disulfide isomerase/thioredoxin
MSRSALVLLAVALSPALARAGDSSRIVCNLGAFTKAERARHIQLIAMLKDKVAQMREVERGYAFRYSADLVQPLAEWITLETKCCPFLDFELELEPQPGGAAWLRLLGDDEVKEFIRTDFKPLIQIARPKGASLWRHDEAQAVAESQRTGKPLLVDFRADWCGACKMLDADTWADPAVRAELLAHYVPLQIDMTAEDEATKEIAERYGVSGLPTILAGKRRITGFVRPAAMLEALRSR